MGAQSSKILSEAQIRNDGELVLTGKPLGAQLLSEDVEKDLVKYVEMISGIRKIMFTKCQIERLPSYLGYFDQLMVLDLTGNGLCTLEGVPWNKLLFLQDLTLDSNIISTFPTEAASLPSLRTFSIARNALISEPQSPGAAEASMLMQPSTIRLDTLYDDPNLVLMSQTSGSVPIRPETIATAQRFSSAGDVTGGTVKEKKKKGSGKSRLISGTLRGLRSATKGGSAAPATAEIRPLEEPPVFVRRKSQASDRDRVSTSTDEEEGNEDLALKVKQFLAPLSEDELQLVCTLSQSMLNDLHALSRRSSNTSSIGSAIGSDSVQSVVSAKKVFPHNISEVSLDEFPMLRQRRSSMGNQDMPKYDIVPDLLPDLQYDSGSEFTTTKMGGSPYSAESLPTVDIDSSRMAKRTRSAFGGSSHVRKPSVTSQLAIAVATIRGGKEVAPPTLVSFNPFHAMRFLNLSHNELSIFPQEITISFLLSLESLDLSHNQIECIPEGLSALPALFYIDLSHNCLRKVPATLFDMPKLKDLRLTKNEISCLPTITQVNTTLKKLDLSRNMLDVIPPSFEMLKGLQVLRLSQNQLESLGEGVFGMAELRSLIADSNSIQALSDNIGALSLLSLLNLANNRLITIPDSISLLQGLTTLNLESNKLASLPMNLRFIPAITDINLRNNEFKQVPPSTLTMNLITFTINENPLEDEDGVKYIKKKGSLGYLRAIRATLDSAIQGTLKKSTAFHLWHPVFLLLIDQMGLPPDKRVEVMNQKASKKLSLLISSGKSLSSFVRFPATASVAPPTMPMSTSFQVPNIPTMSTIAITPAAVSSAALSSPGGHGGANTSLLAIPSPQYGGVMGSGSSVGLPVYSGSSVNMYYSDNELDLSRANNSLVPTESPTYIMTKTEVTENDLITLNVQLSSMPMHWVESFVACQSVQRLISLLDPSAATGDPVPSYLERVLACLRTLLRSNYLSPVVSHVRATLFCDPCIGFVAVCLTLPNMRLLRAALDYLIMAQNSARSPVFGALTIAREQANVANELMVLAMGLQLQPASEEDEALVQPIRTLTLRLLNHVIGDMPMIEQRFFSRISALTVPSLDRIVRGRTQEFMTFSEELVEQIELFNEMMASDFAHMFSQFPPDKIFKGITDALEEKSQSSSKFLPVVVGAARSLTLIPITGDPAKTTVGDVEELILQRYPELNMAVSAFAMHKMDGKGPCGTLLPSSASLVDVSWTDSVLFDYRKKSYTMPVYFLESREAIKTLQVAVDPASTCANIVDQVLHGKFIKELAENVHPHEALGLFCAPISTKKPMKASISGASLRTPTRDLNLLDLKVKMERRAEEEKELLSHAPTRDELIHEATARPEEVQVVGAFLDGFESIRENRRAKSEIQRQRFWMDPSVRLDAYMLDGESSFLSVGVFLCFRPIKLQIKFQDFSVRPLSVVPYDTVQESVRSIGQRIGIPNGHLDAYGLWLTEWSNSGSNSLRTGSSSSNSGSIDLQTPLNRSASLTASMSMTMSIKSKSDVLPGRWMANTENLVDLNYQGQLLQVQYLVKMIELTVWDANEVEHTLMVDPTKRFGDFEADVCRSIFAKDQADSFRLVATLPKRYRRPTAPLDRFTSSDPDVIEVQEMMSAFIMDAPPPSPSSHPILKDLPPAALAKAKQEIAKQNEAMGEDGSEVHISNNTLLLSVPNLHLLRLDIRPRPILLNTRMLAQSAVAFMMKRDAVVRFGKDNNREIIQTANVSGLVQYLLDPVQHMQGDSISAENEYEYHRSVFFDTYRSFVSPQELFDLLMMHYHQQKTGSKKAQSRPTVFGLLKYWMEVDYANIPSALGTRYLDFLQLVARSDNLVTEAGLVTLIRSLTRTANVPALMDQFSGLQVSMPLMEVEALEVARQLCLLDFSYFSRLTPYEFHNCGWQNAANYSRSENLLRFSKRFNDLSRSFASLIVSERQVHRRREIMKKLVDVAVHLRTLRNYHAVMAIVACFSNASVTRLHATKDKLPLNTKRALSELETLMEMENNYRNYRKEIAAAAPPCIPYTGLVLQDYTFIDDGNPDEINHLVNMRKNYMMYNCVNNLLKFTSFPYRFDYHPGLLNYLHSLPSYSDGDLHRLSLIREPRVS